MFFLMLYLFFIGDVGFVLLIFVGGLYFMLIIVEVGFMVDIKFIFNNLN